jgi:hypothetical protein
MKFLTIVFWVMNADGTSFIRAKRLYQPPDFTGISQKNTDGRNGVLIALNGVLIALNGVLIALLFYII